MRIVPPAPPVWDAADFAEGFQRLLPTGPVWPRDQDAIQTQALAALVPTYVRNTEAASTLIADAFPSTAIDMLSDWEGVLGLPDPCAGPDPTIELRQLHVVARLTQQNGPSIPSLIAYAAALGFTITITEFNPARYGWARYGDPLNGSHWAHAWRITQTNGEVRSAEYGSAHEGDPYQSWGNQVLECEMRRIAPAHTILQFAYADVGLATT